MVVWAYWPYNDLVYAEGERSLIGVTERTSEGVPVVRQGQPLRWEVPFCNRGVNTYSERWMDIYGKATESGFVDTTSHPDVRTASFGVPPVVFWAKDAGQSECGEAEVYAIIPSYVAPGSFYRFRVVSSYEPNPIRTVNVTSETELFFYAGVDDGTP